MGKETSHMTTVKSSCTDILHGDISLPLLGNSAGHQDYHPLRCQEGPTGKTHSHTHQRSGAGSDGE